MYTFKGTVKRLEFNAGNGNTYRVSFDYCDSNKVCVQGTEYGVAYELTNVDSPNLDSLKTNESFIIQNSGIFDFLSQHAKENLEISYNDLKEIEKVVLCYE